MKTGLRNILTAAALLALGGTAATEPSPQPPPIAEITNIQAPQRFLDAFRESDEESMRAIGGAKHLDPFLIADALHRAHLGGALAEPPAPRDYLASAAVLARYAENTPRGAGLTRLVKAWGRLDRPGLERASRVMRADYAATAALEKKAYDEVLRIVAASAADIREAETSLGAVELLRKKGLALESLGRFEEAAVVFARAVAAADRLGWRPRKANGLLHGGHCAYRFGDYRRARDLTEQAREVYRGLGRTVGVMRAEHNLAIILTRAGQPTRARALATRLREHCVAAGASVEAAGMLLVLASAASVLGDHRETVRYCEQAAEEFDALGDPMSAASAVSGMGLALSEEGRYAAALHAFDLALRALGDAEATALRAGIALNRGIVHRRLGLLGDARRLQEQALALFFEAGDLTGAARARTNLAALVFEQGEFTEAARLWEDLLAHWRGVGETTEAAKTASNLAGAYRRLGRLDDAEKAAARALEGFRSSGSADLRAHAERQLAQVALARGDLDAARRYAGRSIASFEAIGAGSRLEAHSHRVLAGVHVQGGDPAAALAALDRAREIEQWFGHGLGEITGIELRSKVRPTSDLGVVAAHQLAKAEPGRAKEALAAAFSFAESGRGLLLAEQLTNADVLLTRHLPADLLEFDALTRADVVAAQKALVRLMGRAGAGTDAIVAARKTLDDAWTRRRETIGRIQREARHVADLVYPTPARIEEVRRCLGVDSALVMFHLAEERAYAIVVTKAGGGIHALGRPDEITDTARRYLRLVASPGGPEGRLAGRLYDRLIAPLETDLDGMTRLVICPDGLLAFLPWPALREGPDDRPRRLIEAFETVLVPSATVFVTVAKESAGDAPGAALVALGNPSYPTAGPFPPLPASAEEVRAIGRLFPKSSRRVLLGASASQEALEGALGETEGRLRALHLACHAYVDDANPRLSTLVLAGGELMDLDAIYRLRTPADLVVVSSCASARGKIIRGEGPLGFVRGFLFSGARRVVASNWKVSDDSTATLMTRLYEGFVRDGLSPAAALRRAQLGMLREGGEIAHPHHWAAFTLWGPAE